MVSEIRIYVEGAGTDSASKTALRRGFTLFLGEIHERARQARIGWYVVACRSRGSAFKDFATAVHVHPSAFNVLLVDSEEPLYLANGPWDHLRQRDQAAVPHIPDDHFHLMVRMMEAWLIADPAALQSYYGQHFNAGALPANPNVEQVDKATLQTGLRNATQHTQKREYHKTRHGFELLGRLDAAKVRSAASYCDRLFATLMSKM